MSEAIKPKRIAVLGSGSWGTALASHLRGAGHDVTIWGLETEALKSIEKTNTNPDYFPGLSLSSGIKAEAILEESVKEKEVVVFSVPSGAMRDVSKKVAKNLANDALLVNTAKGLEAETNKRMTEVIKEETGTARASVLSGPSFAKEVLEKRPTAVTTAAHTMELAKEVAEVFHYQYFRAYTSEDVIGVELGGALKNVIAIAVGIVDGKNFGCNARAALITRGLSEIGELIVKLGGKERTVSGLSVLGDLLLTSTGDLSRNRQVGLRLAKGEELVSALDGVGQVAEGVNTARKVLSLAEPLKLEMPITKEVVHVLEGQHSIEVAVEKLLSRAPSHEK